MSIIKKLMQGLEKKYKTAAIIAPLSIMGEVLLEVFIPLIMARIIDIGIANRDVSYVIRTGALMVGAALLSLICGCVAARFAAVASFGFSRNLRRRLFDKVQNFSFANVDKFSTASLVTRLTTDVTNVQNTFQMIIRMCFRAPFMFISAIAMSMYINRRLSVVFLICIPLIAIPVGFIMVKTFPRFQKMFKKYDELNGNVQENLIGIRAVKAFVREDFEKKKFDDTADSLRKLQVNAEKMVILNWPIMQLVMFLGIIAVLWFGGNMIIVGDMHTGELISFITYLIQILMSLMMISMLFVMLNISRASVQRIGEVLDEEIDLKSPPETEKSSLAPADGSVCFKNVSFSYDKNPDTAVLRDVNISIPSGSVVGILGGTGSSKTTLVHLIPRLYDVLDGSVEVGGRDVRTYTLDTLRSNISMVLQKNVLFSGTIEENLRWGNPSATEEEIKNACVAACADRFISTFPDGYKTVLGQGGVNVSGGQKQRLCIARALLKKPKILILDDSTSAVDTATDASIRKSLRESLPETTKIIIAQRVASVQDADIIFILDEGRVVDSGTHEKLLSSCEIYREVYESQLKGSGDMDKVEED